MGLTKVYGRKKARPPQAKDLLLKHLLPVYDLSTLAYRHFYDDRLPNYV
jgi:hypothetical protein